MPIHPQPPSDLVDVVEGFRQVFQSLIDVGYTCGPQDFALPTSCPGWDVKDHFAHVAAVEAYLEGAEQPETELGTRDHVHGEFNEWMEHGVQARRETPGEEIVHELETLLYNRLATLANPELTLETSVRAPMDSTTGLGDLLRIRLIDIWVHLQDVREALGRPGDLDTPAAATFVASIQRAFPRIVAQRVQLPEGHTVILESTGPVTGRVGVRMSHTDEGKPWAHPLFTGDLGDEGEGSHHTSGEPEEEGPATTILLTTDALTRRAAGRRSTEDTSYRVVGDEELARAVLDALVITP